MLKQQFIRYLISGVSALALHMAILAFLVELFAIDETVASGTGFFFAVLLNYTIQHRWVFAADGNHLNHFQKYLLVTLLTFSVNIVFFWVAVNIVGVWYPLAQLLTTGFIFLLNFIVNRNFTFKNLK